MSSRPERDSTCPRPRRGDLVFREAAKSVAFLFQNDPSQGLAHQTYPRETADYRIGSVLPSIVSTLPPLATSARIRVMSGNAVDGTAPSECCDGCIELDRSPPQISRRIPPSRIKSTTSSCGSARSNEDKTPPRLTAPTNGQYDTATVRDGIAAQDLRPS